MYNEEIKNRYIDTINNPDIIRVIFSKCETIERLLEKDVYDFSERDIERLLYMINTPSVHTLTGHISQLKIYTDWAINQNLVRDGINHFAYSTTGLERYVNKFWAEEKILSYEDYKWMMDSLKEPDQRFILGCLWHGIKGDSCSEIGISKIEDFDPDTMTAKIYNLDEEGNRVYSRIVPIDERTLSSAAISSQTYELIIQTVKGIEKRYSLVGNTIIKVKEANDAKFTVYNVYQRIRSRFDKIKMETGRQALTMNSVFYSGMCHRFQQLSENKADLPELIRSTEGKKILDDYNKSDVYPSSIEKMIAKQYWQ